MTRWLEPDQVPDLLRPGSTIFCPGGTGEPDVLWQALRRRPDCLEDVHVVDLRLPGFRSESYDDLPCQVTSCFLTRELGEAWKRGQLRFVPMHYRDTWDWLRSLTFDLALIEVTAPDSQGRVSHGLTCDFVPAILDRARVLVAQVNSALPDPPGSPRLALDRIDHAAEVDRAPPTTGRGEPDATTREIAARVAALVPDGACLQTGIGALPGAVLAALAGHSDLGIHSGMISDGVMELAASGALSGERKTRDRGQVVTGFAYGSSALYDWLAEEPSVLFQPVDVTHDPRVLAELDRFTAINSAIEVDLFGQVNAESIGSRPVSGPGGAVDFLRGAARSRDGRSIVALPSTAAGGKRSRIVPALATGTPATALRTDVDWIVTEHGAASLLGRSVEERAEALIGIAAPEFRPELVDAWSELRRQARGL